MNNQEFKWTDELVKEFSTQLALDSVFNAQPRIDLEQFKASKQKPLEYEILAMSRLSISKDCIRYKNKDGLFYFKEGSMNATGYELQHLLEFDIFSVKRISDNCIFSIGDETKQGAIKELSINGTNELLAYLDYGIPRGSSIVPLYLLQKTEPKKQPILITHDGIELFSGNTCAIIELPSYKVTTCLKLDSIERPNQLYFSSKEAAEEYSTLNKLCLSVQDIVTAFSHVFYDKNSFMQELIELAKSKNK